MLVKNISYNFTKSVSSVQTVPLRAHLCLPTLSLSIDTISFGFCYVGQTQTREVKLYVQGAHTSWTSLISNPAITHATMSGSFITKNHLSCFIEFCFAHQPWSDLSLCLESDAGKSQVFRLLPDFGLLRSSVTTCSQHLELSFTPRYPVPWSNKHKTENIGLVNICKTC